MKKITIQGKDYISIHERLKEFWKCNPTWSIRTDILESEGGKVRFRACIYDEHGILLGDSMQEKRILLIKPDLDKIKKQREEPRTYFLLHQMLANKKSIIFTFLF